MSIILQNLTEVGRQQVEFADRPDFRGSLEWSLTHFPVLGGAGGHRFSKLFDNLREEGVDESEDVVDMNFALGKASARPSMPTAEGMSDLSSVPIPEEPEQESVPEPVNQAIEPVPEQTGIDKVIT